MDDTRYPCPACGASADLKAGCAGCRRPPDPLAAEVVRLGREVARLEPEVERARRTYTELAGQLTAATRRRAELAAVVRAAHPVMPAPQVARAPLVMPVPQVAPGPQAVPGRLFTPAPVVPTGSPPRAAETSTRTVQGLLFVLGGLLLGTAAVVFTAVAWASVGVAGRALILAAVTALTLAAPLVAVRRGLRGTAETFAAVGLLLVLLDGYAAWSVNLGGVTDWPGTRYAALVGGASAAIAVGYARLSGLTGPWFAALLAAQPVLPLLAAGTDFGATGWTLVLLGVALLNLAVLYALRNGPGSARFAGQIVAGVGQILALFGAAACALVPLLYGQAFDSPLLAGAPLLLVALTGLGTAWLIGGPMLRTMAAGLLVPVLAAALVRPVGELRPSLLLFAAAMVTLGLAGAVRLLPAGWQTGPRVGALLVAVGAAQVALVITSTLAFTSAARSLPPWDGAALGPDLAWGWQVAPAVALTFGAAALLLPRSVWGVLASAGGVAVLLAVPIAWTASWPAVVAVDLAGGVVLLLAALVRPSTRPAILLSWAFGGAVLLAHALLVALAAPVGFLVVLGTVAVLGVALTVRRAVGPYRWVAGVGLAVAQVALPGIAVVALFAAGVAPWWQARAALATAGLALAGVLLVRRHRENLTGYAVGGATLVAAVSGLAPIVVVRDEPVTLYAALASLGVAFVARWDLSTTGAEPAGSGEQPAAGDTSGPQPVIGGPSAVGGSQAIGGPPTVGGPPVVGLPGALNAVAGVVLAGVAVLAALPTVLSALVRPYDGWGKFWSGVPTVVAEPERFPAGLALVAVALVAVLLGREVRPPWLPALPFAAAALPVLLVAAGAPWPVLPAAMLLSGVATLVYAALAAPRPALAPIAVPVGAVLVAVGLAGLVANRAGTLAAEGVLLVAAVVVAVAARATGVRVTGCLAAIGAACALAVTAPLADGQPLRAAAYPLLAVAAVVLALGALTARPRRAGTAPVADSPQPAGSAHAQPGVAAQAQPAASAVPPSEARARIGRVLDAAAQAVAVVAALLTIGSTRHFPTICVLWGVAVALRLLRRGEPAGRRWAFGGIAAVSELIGVWALLESGGVTVLEAYTVPAAALALGAGLLALRTRPDLTSWLALGPGLAAALLPSLVSVLAGSDPQPWRRLLLGAAALGTVLGGATRRWQAPVVLGGAVLAVLALHEVALSWDLLPRWLYLGVGGLALIALAATYERRRRDLARLRDAVGRLG
ncbi:SCO7613 C-terminal domain-containing membrane protein [Micromonospora profundi]|uniref:SCO7613 C-terminal domain-containing membrane protein n=1 Tax=Micromonospora TaxID=1873 RepID=UPI0033AC9DA8